MHYRGFSQGVVLSREFWLLIIIYRVFYHDMSERDGTLYGDFSHDYHVLLI